jgi:dihydrofolate synthase/folylpolyglutamate synthase
VTPRDSLKQALAGLYARVPLGMRMGLGPMLAACEAFGHPERAFPTIHVAGTNGKGSVCAMVESIARAHGMRTGLYTSPHLCRFAERIRIAGEPLEDAGLGALLRQVLDGAPDLSFFETSTLAAFCAFREAGVDIAVLEVGIGGRLDATNVIPPPRASAITRIAVDHTDRLGPTLGDIAREKAGIAKRGVPLVLGPIDGEPLRVIETVARDAGAIVEHAGPAAASGLVGAHQRDNAGVAAALGAHLGASNGEQADGIALVSWPGRLETIDTADGGVLLDAAHNPDGVQALTRHLATLGVSVASTALVFGTLADKAWPLMLDLIAPLAAHRVYVRPEGRAASDPADLAARHPGRVAPSVAEALALARKAAGAKGLVVVCGSIFLVGEARALLLDLERDPPVAL